MINFTGHYSVSKKKGIQGDVTGIVDGNCGTVEEYTYDAWGKLSRHHGL